MIETSNIEKAKQYLRNGKDVEIRAQDIEFNRKILSYGKFKFLVFPSKIKSKRKLKIIDSNLDRVAAKDAAKNNISITYDLKEITLLSKKEKAVELESLKKNIKIARKAKAQIALKNEKNEKDAKALMLSLGSSTKQATKSIGF